MENKSIGVFNVNNHKIDKEIKCHKGVSHMNANLSHKVEAIQCVTMPKITAGFMLGCPKGKNG